MLDLATAKLILDALKLGYEAISSGAKLRKKDKEKIAKEAARLVTLATEEDIDKLVAEPRRKSIDYMTGAAERVRWRGGAPPHLRKKAAPRMAAKTRRTLYKKVAKKKR